MRHIAHSLILALLLATEAGAQDSTGSREGRHRLDLSFNTHDAEEADVYTVLPGYTYTLANQFRLGIITNYTYISSTDAGRDLGVESDSGWGDTDFNLQYAPSQQLTSSPWVPDTLGLSLGLTAPTGDADKSLGGDQWVYRIGAGWAYNAWSHLYLAPSASYEHSFSEGSDALGLEYLGMSLGIYWVTASGFWFGYTPYLERDLEFYEWADDHSVIIGKMWPNGLGLSLEYGQARRIDDTAKRDDYTGLINFYYQFGRPPL